MISEMLFHTKSAERSRFNRRLSDFILRLQKSLELTDDEILSVLKIEHKQLTKLKKGQFNLDIIKFCDLAVYCKFNLDAFFRNKIDFETLRQHKHGSETHISDCYMKGAFSKKRLLITTFDYIESNYNWQLKEDLLSYFQLNKSLYTDPDGSINVYLFEDVLSKAVQYGLSIDDISQIGYHSVRTSMDSQFAHALSGTGAPKALYEKYFVELIGHIEHNNEYRIVYLDKTSCIVESREITNNLDVFKVKHIGGPLRCLYRLAALEAATQYIGLPRAKVIETECVHRGDLVCKFHINYEGPFYNINNKFLNSQSGYNYGAFN